MGLLNTCLFSNTHIKWDIYNCLIITVNTTLECPIKSSRLLFTGHIFHCSLEESNAICTIPQNGASNVFWNEKSRTSESPHCAHVPFESANVQKNISTYVA